jgi:uncharacterized lipoprotein YmbA
LSIRALCGAAVCLLAAACASQHDNFYTLSVLPKAAAPTAQPQVHVILSMDIPALVDRAEMVLSTSPTEVKVLDHERWVSSLSDQVQQTLARDLERRRSDVLVSDRGDGPISLEAVQIRVDVVRMDASDGRAVSLEAHWRIKDERAGRDEVGTGVFEAALGGGFVSIANAYSETLAALADKIAARIPTPASSTPR